MATTQNTYTGNGSTTNYSFTFPYLETTDIKVSVNGVNTTAYTLANATTVSFNSAPANGAAIRIYRVTDDSALAATFYPGSAIRSQDLNDNYTQILYRAQEVTNYSIQDAGSVTLSANYAFSGTAAGQTPTLSSHFATKGYVDGVLTASGNLTNGDKGDITVSGLTTWTIDNDAITTAKILNGAVTAAKLADTYATAASPTITGQPYINGSYRGNVVAVAALNIDCSLGNTFTKTISSNSTFTVSNVPASRSYAFTLELTHTSGTITWFSGVVWPGGTAPTLTTGKVHLFMFFTDDSGTTWRASSLINY